MKVMFVANGPNVEIIGCKYFAQFKLYNLQILTNMIIVTKYLTNTVLYITDSQYMFVHKKWTQKMDNCQAFYKNITLIFGIQTETIINLPFGNDWRLSMKCNHLSGSFSNMV